MSIADGWAKHPTREAQEGRGIVLIGGPCRVGKTLAASELSRRTGFRILKTDRIRHRYVSIEDPDERLDAKWGTFFELAERENGLIIEGEELIYKNRGKIPGRRRSEIEQDASLNLDLAVEMRRHFGAHVFCLGSARGGAEDKARSIMAYGASNHCWLMERRPPYAQVVRIASGIVKKSAQLRQLSEQHGIDYFDVGNEDGKADLARAVETMWRRLREPAVP